MDAGFEPVTDDRRRLLPLLLLADESASIVLSYIDLGTLFVLRSGGADVGVLLLIPEGETVEIKNLALAEEARGQGLGRSAITFAARWARDAGASRLTVGTADSSPGAIRFYERVGFRRSGVRPGFFDDYPEPVWEDGVRARDMIMFEMALEVPATPRPGTG